MFKTEQITICQFLPFFLFQILFRESGDGGAVEVVGGGEEKVEERLKWKVSEVNLSVCGSVCLSVCLSVC